MDRERIGRAILSALGIDAETGEARPKTPSGWLAGQNGVEQFAYTSAIDGRVCPGCGSTDGVVIVVPGADAKVTGCDLLLFAFDHGGSPESVAYSIEQCKQLVNRLGEAIAVAEGVGPAST